MARVIKRGEAPVGDISPDTGFADGSSGKRSRVISGDAFAAKNEASTILERAQTEADEQLDRAKQTAEQIVEKARNEADEIRERAREEGHEEGRNQAATELSEIVAQASRRWQQIEAEAVPQLKALALSIARKVLGIELQTRPEAVVEIVKQALGEKARQRREIFLRVHPEDLKYIREHKAELVEVLSRCSDIGLREDAEVARHGVIIETEAGVIDAQLEGQLAVFERVLKDLA